MATSKTSEIILGRVEHINASHFNCLSFAKASDMVNGINVRLSNMAGGYPFSFGGVTWRDSETLYLCGEFSDASDKHLLVQEDMQRQTSGFAAKRFIKKRNSNLIRQDFADFRIQWMLYVIWQKCKGNADFANLLLKLPHDAIIIEDTIGNTLNPRIFFTLFFCVIPLRTPVIHCCDLRLWKGLRTPDGKRCRPTADIK